MTVRNIRFISGLTVLAFILLGGNYASVRAQASAFPPGKYNDVNAAITYDPRWFIQTADRALGAEHIKTISYGKNARFAFNGNQLVVIYTKTPESGKFEVVIDGHAYVFSGYAATRQYQARWTSPRLSSGYHSVAIKKRVNDGRPIFFDGIQILNIIVVADGQSIQTSCIDEGIPGSTCIVTSGTYNERVTVSKRISLTCKGACMVTGGVDVSADRVILRGFELTSRGIMLNGQYDVIENNYIHDLDSEIGILFYDGLTVGRAKVRKNIIVRANNACILIAGTANLIEGNDCSATKQPPTYDGDADCFRYFGSNHVIRNNTCHDIWYGESGYNPSLNDFVNNAHIDCFQTWNWESRGGVGHDILFQGNYCDLPDQGDEVQAKGLQTEGLTSDGGIDLSQDYPCHNLTFKNNVVHSNLLGIFKYCQDITLLNNTFVGDVSPYSGGLHLLSLRGTNIIQYNIFVDQDDGAYTSYSDATRATVVGGYNFIYRSNGVPDGSPQKGDIWDVDPRFVDRAGGDYHLRAGSPACGWGAFPCY